MRGTRQIAVLVTRDGETPTGKVGSVCPPCFSILLQRRELFIPHGGVGIWRSRPKCKISVAPESLPPGLQPPSHPLRGAGLGPGAREGGRALRAATRGRQSVSAGAAARRPSCRPLHGFLRPGYSWVARVWAGGLSSVGRDCMRTELPLRFPEGGRTLRRQGSARSSHLATTTPMGAWGWGEAACGRDVGFRSILKCDLQTHPPGELRSKGAAEITRRGPPRSRGASPAPTQPSLRMGVTHVPWAPRPANRPLRPARSRGLSEPSRRSWGGPGVKPHRRLGAPRGWVPGNLSQAEEAGLYSVA